MKCAIVLLASLLCTNLMGQVRPSPASDSTHHKHVDPEEEYERIEHSNERNLYANAHSSWYRQMMKKHPNVKKAEAAFAKYFLAHPDKESTLKDRFESWVGQARLYMDKRGFALPAPAGLPPAGPFLPGAASGPDNTFGSWTMIGPANMAYTECNQNNLVTGGFIDRVYVNPYNTKNLFAGFSYGGLWVSTDQGATWQLTDGSFANGTNTYANRDYYYGEIKANPLDSAQVFAATEAGLLKSVNGGVNWTLCPTLNRGSSPNSRPYYISQAVDDQATVLSTFGQKVYRSTDGGSTWTVVFDNSSGGQNHTFTSQYNFNTPFGLNDRTYNFFGLEADYSNPNHFYLGVWNNSNQACIYQSTDKGATFSLLINLNTLLGAAWGSGTTLCMKTIPSSPSKFFVYQQFVSNRPYYKFASGGFILDSSIINTYPEAFDIDWTNENTLYQGEYGVYNSVSGFQKSVDEGTTFNPPSSLASGKCNYLHADIRGVSAVGNVVLIGDDGGLGLSLDTGASLTGTGFGITSMDMWGFSSSRKSDICLTGLDHNQTFVRRSAAPGGWINIKGADATVCTVNPYNDRWLYYNWAYGINKGYLNPDGTVTESSVSPLPDLGSLEFDSYLTGNIYGIQSSNNDIVVHSTDNMTTSTPFHTFGSPVNAIRVARRDPRTLYVLLNQSVIQSTSDSGATWVTVTPPASISGGQTNITAIEVGKTPGELWAAYGNAQNTAKVLYSTNGGVTWTNITTSNLPAAAVSNIAYQRGTNGGVYISIITAAGTTIWYKNNTMASWQQLGNTMPLMGYIRGRLFVVPAAGKIRFGGSRGAWESPLYEPSVAEAGIAADTRGFGCGTSDSIQFYDASAYAPGTASYSWQFPGGSPDTSTQENPKVSYPTPGTYPVTLTITTPAGSDTETIQRFVYYDSTLCCSGAPAGWTFTDIGPSVTPSTLCYIQPTGNFKMTSNGAGLGDPNDTIAFVYRPLPGNGMITARIKDVSSTYNYDAGVMVRNSLAPNSAYVFLSSLDTRGVFDQWRATDGGSSAYNAVTAFPMPLWLRLQRRGSSLSSFYSTDGRTWTPYHNYTISLGDTVYVGLASSGKGNVSDMDSVAIGPIPPCIGGSAAGCPAVDSVPGKAIQFSNYTYFNVPVTSPATNTFTITGWIKPAGLLGSQSSILAWDQGYFYLGQNNDNQLEYVWNSTNASNTWNSGLFAQPNQWSFVAMVIHPDSATLYLNDHMATDLSPQGASAVTDGILGNSNPGAGYFLGNMDEVTVWTRALSTREIDSLRHLTRDKMAGGSDPSLISYFQFNDTLSGASYNEVDSTLFSFGAGAGKTVSTAPVGGGRSAMQTVNGPGTYAFTGTGLSATFQGAYPNGPVWVSRLNQLPDQYPHASLLPPAYWIMDNYGADSAFTPVASLTVDSVLSSGTYRLYKRPVNGEQFTWGSPVASATVTSPGSLRFDTTGVASEGQLFVNGGAPAPAADSVAGNLLDLTPAGDPVVSLSPVPLNSNTFTITMWVKPQGLQKVFSQLIASNTPNSYFGIGFAFPGYTNNLNVVFSSNAIPYWQQSNINLDSTRWNHLALVYTPDSVSIYLDGGTPWTFASPGLPPIDFTEAPVMVNADIHNQGGNFKGQIDEVAFYDYALSQEEIREKMHLTKTPGVEPGLVGYYQFNQYNSNTDTLYDAMGNGVASRVDPVNIAPSTTPVSAGTSFGIPSVSAPGSYTFGGTGATLTFPGPMAPNGEVVVSRLNSSPDSLPQGYKGPYWIVRNWGAPAAFTTTLAASGINPADTLWHHRPQLFGRTPGGAFLDNWMPQCFAASGSPDTAAFLGCNDTAAGQLFVGLLPPPVTLLTFTGDRQRQHAVLQWTVSGESGISHYSVQRQALGSSFVTIGTVAANGGSQYTFTDDLPLDGRDYYRLKVVEDTMDYIYSKVVALDFQGEKFVRIIPNPVAENAPVTIQNLSKSEARVELFLSDGKLFGRYVVPALGSVPVGHLPRGNVFYRAVNDEGMRAAGVEVVL